MRAIALLSLSLLLSFAMDAQEYRVFGRVTDVAGRPLPGATVLPQGSRSAAVTDADGRYDLPLRDPGEVAIRFTFIGFDPVTRNAILTPEGTRLDVRLRAGVALNQAEVEADGTRTSPIQRIDPRVASRVPSVRGTVEDLLIQAPVNFTSEPLQRLQRPGWQLRREPRLRQRHRGLSSLPCPRRPAGRLVLSQPRHDPVHPLLRGGL